MQGLKSSFFNVLLMQNNCVDKTVVMDRWLLYSMSWALNSFACSFNFMARIIENTGYESEFRILGSILCSLVIMFNLGEKW
jgi:hypothetical protein